MIRSTTCRLAAAITAAVAVGFAPSPVGANVEQSELVNSTARATQ